MATSFPTIAAAASTVPRIDAADALERLKHVEGMDISSAIARMGGDRDLYQRLLQGFACRADSLAEQLETLSVSDLPAMAHKLKGECANLGLTLLASTCADLETTLKQAPAQRPAEALSLLCKYLRVFPAQMAQTVAAPLRIFDEASKKEITDKDREEIVTLLDQLPALLKEQRMQALKHSDRLQEILKGTRWQMPFILVHSHISQLQFAAASGALQEFRSAFDASWR